MVKYYSLVDGLRGGFQLGGRGAEGHFHDTLFGVFQFFQFHWYSSMGRRDICGGFCGSYWLL